MEFSSVKQVDAELNQHVLIPTKQILYLVHRHELSFTLCYVFTDEKVSRVGILDLS
jgi:hypothetical protein